MVVVVLSSAGCIGGFFSNSGPDAGQVQISNAHNASHTVVIHDVDGEDISTTVAPSKSETVALFDTPGNYTVNATIDESTTLDYC